MSRKKGRKKRNKPARKQGAGRPLSMSMAAQALRRIEPVLLDESSDTEAVEEAYERLQRIEEKYVLPPSFYDLLLVAADRLDLPHPDILATIERGAERFPDEPTLRYNLAEIYRVCAYFALSRNALVHFLQRWPDHSAADKARESLARLDEHMPELLEPSGLRWPEDEEHAVRSERVRRYLERGEWSEATEAARSLLAQRPELIPVRNNLARALWEHGEMAGAIDEQREALRRQPDRPMALANMVRFLSLTGRFDEAREWGERAEELEVSGPDALNGLSEVAAFLGNDELVIRIADSTRELGSAARHGVRPDLPLLAGTAWLRRGDADRARRWWSSAGSSGYIASEAAARIAELDRPEDDRNGPWYFNVHDLLPRAVASAIREAMSGEEAPEQARESLRAAVEEFPGAKGMLRYLLEAGDDTGRYFALSVADCLGLEELSPTIFELVRDGTARRERREQAMRILASWGGTFEIPAEQIERPAEQIERPAEPERTTTVRVQTWEIVFDQMETVPDDVGEIYQAGYEALQENRLDRAESLFNQALEIRDDIPAVWQNLIATYERKGKRKKAYRMIEEVHRRFPDYSFARFGIAIREVQSRDNPERAHELLKPITERERLHITELTGLCHAKCIISMKERDIDAASHWYGIWKEFAPEDDRLGQFALLDLYRKLVAR